MVRPSELIGSESVVQITGFELAPGVAEDEFLAAWRRAAAQEDTPAGLVCRELCRQITPSLPRIQAEAQHPNPFAFVDYAIFRGEQHLAALAERLQRTSPTLSDRYEAIDGLYRVAHCERRPDAAGEPAMVLYNFFQVDGGPEAEQAFAARWQERVRYQAQQDGFYSAVLHTRALPVQRFSCVNRAEWRDPEAYAASLEGFELAFPRAQRGGPAPAAGPPRVGSFLGVFRVVASLSG